MASVWSQQCCQLPAPTARVCPSTLPFSSQGLQEPKPHQQIRCGCHGLHVDTDRLLPLAHQVPREQRRVLCAFDSAKDEHHLVFDCPAYSTIRNQIHKNLLGPAPRLSSSLTLHDPKVIYLYR